MVNYEKIVRSSHFTFLIGEDKTPLSIHAAVLEKLSAPLHALFSNGYMKESQAKVATLDDVDVETFAAFSEFAYTNNYKTPARKCAAEKPPRSIVPKPYRISKRSWTCRPKVQTARKYCNKALYPSGTGQKDFDAFHFEDIGESFRSRKFGSKAVKSNPNLNLLLHAKLYVFSTKYLIEPLRQNCPVTIHEDLLHLGCAKASHLVLALLEYVYSNTGRTEPTGESLLRDLVIHYVASKMPILSKHEDFFAVLDPSAEMGSDLAKEMVK
ncbi:hypothetical protein TCE0_033r09439 [Talaromyces pinophilus]|uniref:BTB domain-containing protein n=1 Tax=Talaromyces pinophilus TaxID=128442 RepID=A0A6V8HK03_TALPI|nr:hypothetical protein TCE0_033r09439 [Talaromyces pinophilus]